MSVAGLVTSLLRLELRDTPSTDPGKPYSLFSKGGAWVSACTFKSWRKLSPNVLATVTVESGTYCRRVQGGSNGSVRAPWVATVDVSECKCFCFFLLFLPFHCNCGGCIFSQGGRREGLLKLLIKLFQLRVRDVLPKSFVGPPKIAFKFTRQT